MILSISEKNESSEIQTHGKVDKSRHSDVLYVALFFECNRCTKR